ncbi:MAG: gliding motility-associated C-terminal domain-containing protein [Chitinophagaceae bacterium]|nr:MAG: gliding motility-associated C-terminal domain-containing protein [Chitinophagaceae bacterium]
MNPDGSTALARKSPGLAAAGFRYIRVGPNGNLYVSVFPISSNWNVNGLVEMDKDFNTLRKQFMRVDKGSFNSTLLVQGDSVVYSTGSLYDDNPYWSGTYLQKYNFNSSFASCEVSDLDYQTLPYTQPSLPVTNTVSTPPLPFTISHNAVFLPADIAYSGYRCGNNNVCTDLRLDGPETICDTSLIIDYAVVRNAGCSGIAVWRLDTIPGQVSIVSISDTLLQLKLMKAGDFKIHVKSFASCEWLEDSLVITGSTSSAMLNLGNDTSLCPGNRHVLHAGPDFASYLWQDGSTDSVYVAAGPGTYYVDVLSCGVTYSDTVHILPVQPPPFSIGPDRVKCNADTLQLAAPAGFRKYLWANNYQINSTNVPLVVVNPLQDTMYYVTAETDQGCVVSDTVRIMVRTSPAVNLGRDTSFCAGAAVEFDAGSGFISFLWNGGQTTSAILVNAAGSYSVKATTSEGCSSYDTIRVLNVNPLPVAGLTKNAVLCAGQSARLSASAGFSTYLWNTGAVGNSININSTGSYFVVVTDRNGCSASDSTTIATTLPLPSRFLGSDTAICFYGNVHLAPGAGFASYNWSTGSGNRDITVSVAGQYVLSVTDQWGCRGADTVIVTLKDCPTGFYVPEIFTPNGDRINDVFHPNVLGNVEQYSFRVFNRWGEIIFQSGKLNAGWDGRFKGLPQPAEVYIWTCTFRFAGQAEEFRKGQVILAR